MLDLLLFSSCSSTWSHSFSLSSHTKKGLKFGTFERIKEHANRPREPSGLDNVRILIRNRFRPKISSNNSDNHEFSKFIPLKTLAIYTGKLHHWDARPFLNANQHDQSIGLDL